MAKAIGTVVFVCEHGSAKSVIAAAHFDRLAAAARLDARAISRGTDPDAAFTNNTLEGLARDGLRPAGDAPVRLSARELAEAARVVSFCELPDAYAYSGLPERWEDIPPVSEGYEPARQAIAQRVGQLVRELSSAE